ncbi:alpha/beta hydrolase [Rickettsiales bacterium LUAb2]
MSNPIYAKNNLFAQKIAEQKTYCKVIPHLQVMLNAINKKGNDLDTMTPASVKQIRADRTSSASKVLSVIKVAKVENMKINVGDHSVPVIVYTPSSTKLAKNGKLPILVFVHGGGWTLGNPTTYDSVTRALANYIPAIVVSIDYRLAPENPYPAATTDVMGVLNWLASNADKINGDATRLAIAGDSGGGNLATVAALKTIDNPNIHILQETLFYPSVNIAKTDTDSYKQFGKNYLLTKKSVETFRSFYLPNKLDWNNEDVSPLQAKNLKGMPSTLIITAGCDPLRDEGHAYAVKLANFNVPVTYMNEEGMIHAFLNFYNYDRDLTPYGDNALKKAAKAIAAEFNKH